MSPPEWRSWSARPPYGSAQSPRSSFKLDLLCKGTLILCGDTVKCFSFWIAQRRVKSGQGCAEAGMCAVHSPAPGRQSFDCVCSHCVCACTRACGAGGEPKRTQRRGDWKRCPGASSSAPPAAPGACGHLKCSPEPTSA